MGYLDKLDLEQFHSQLDYLIRVVVELENLEWAENHYLISF